LIRPSSGHAPRRCRGDEEDGRVKPGHDDKSGRRVRASGRWYYSALAL
jgi:hypothetical protein